MSQPSCKKGDKGKSKKDFNVWSGDISPPMDVGAGYDLYFQHNVKGGPRAWYHGGTVWTEFFPNDRSTWFAPNSGSVAQYPEKRVNVETRRSVPSKSQGRYLLHPLPTSERKFYWIAPSSVRNLIAGSKRARANSGAIRCLQTILF